MMTLQVFKKKYFLAHRKHTASLYKYNFISAVYCEHLMDPLKIYFKKCTISLKLAQLVYMVSTVI